MKIRLCFRDRHAGPEEYEIFEISSIAEIEEILAAYSLPCGCCDAAAWDMSTGERFNPGDYAGE